jgi:hypothetical protein
MGKATLIIIDELNKNPDQVTTDLGNTLLKKSSGKEISKGLAKMHKTRAFLEWKKELTKLVKKPIFKLKVNSIACNLDYNTVFSKFIPVGDRAIDRYINKNSKKEINHIIDELDHLFEQMYKLSLQYYCSILKTTSIDTNQTIGNCLSIINSKTPNTFLFNKNYYIASSSLRHKSAYFDEKENKFVFTFKKEIFCLDTNELISFRKEVSDVYFGFFLALIDCSNLKFVFTLMQKFPRVINLFKRFCLK